MHTLSEENYLKLIYKLSANGDDRITTSSVANGLGISPASATEKLQKLADKELINYEKSRGVSLTEIGKNIALKVIRKHRIWETFLVNKLEFGWEEVHEIAEQLEHIDSDKLIQNLEKYLGFPKFDPHGEPIPDVKGKINNPCFKPLTELAINVPSWITGVKEDSESFLRFFKNLGLSIKDNIQIKEIEEFNKSLLVIVNNNRETHISRDVAQYILISTNKECCVFGNTNKECK